MPPKLKTLKHDKMKFDVRGSNFKPLQIVGIIVSEFLVQVFLIFFVVYNFLLSG